MTRTKLLSTLVALALGISCLGALAGCDATAENATDAAAQNRAYMSQANTMGMQLDNDLAKFSEAVAADDIVTMEQTAANAYRVIDAFKEIEAPEAMAGIHAEYSAGCDDLEAALQAYVLLYRESDSLDNEAFNARIADIQEKYDSGIAHLQNGDGLVTKLTGALPSDSSATGEDGGSSSGNA